MYVCMCYLEGTSILLIFVRLVSDDLSIVRGPDNLVTLNSKDELLICIYVNLNSKDDFLDQ